MGSSPTGVARRVIPNLLSAKIQSPKTGGAELENIPCLMVAADIYVAVSLLAAKNSNAEIGQSSAVLCGDDASTVNLVAGDDFSASSRKWWVDAT
ncbi:MAG TPA: hypothetical protein EYN66_02060, partial [Myxococcales bacterium]|nr:hypothetical protein [Myxococcales bacterium]